jgi:hypothetical protein
VAAKKMTTSDMLGEILPVMGTVALLGSWLYQQVGLERRAGELRKLESAHGVYQMYQSNNALFNAINEGLKSKPELSENIRRFQVYNYELGLRAIEDVLSPEEKKGIPAAPDAYSGTESFDQKMQVTQTRLEQLQTRLAAKVERAQAGADSANTIYLWLYVTLSLVSVGGAVCKIMGMKRSTTDAKAA